MQNPRESFAASAGKRGLVPTPTADRPRTQAQEAFRTLLARVEFLRESIDDLEHQLDATLNFYAVEIVPRLARQTALQKDLVRGLAPYVNKSFFPRREERLKFKELTEDLLEAIAKNEKGLVDADLREIYNVVHGSGYMQHVRKTLKAVRAALEEMFAEANIEADFSELDSTATEADFMAKAEELMARVRKLKEAEAEATHCAEHGHHDTGDEALRAAEAFRKRSIANIYKQLARVLHPDFERDSGRQREKVLLMQELTAAYRQNDLHTLLRLEMQWIENEGGDIDQLTEEKLRVYNEVLGSQVEGLERRHKDQVYHSRYRPIVVFNNGIMQAINGPDKTRELDGNIAAIERCIPFLETAKKPDDVRAAMDWVLK